MELLNPARKPDHAILWAGLVLGFLFLLRVGEYAQHDGQPWDEKRGLRGADVKPRRNGEVVRSFREADEVVLTIRGSKTDQLNAGELRSQFVSGKSSA